MQTKTPTSTHSAGRAKTTSSGSFFLSGRSRAVPLLRAPRAVVDVASASSGVADVASASSAASSSAPPTSMLGQALSMIRENVGTGEFKGFEIGSFDAEEQKAALAAAAEQVMQKQQLATKNFVEHLGLPAGLPALPDLNLSKFQLPSLEGLSIDGLSSSIAEQLQQQQQNLADGATSLAGQAGSSLYKAVDSLQVTSLGDVAKETLSPGGVLFQAGCVVDGAWSSVASNFSVFGDNWSLNVLFFAAILGFAITLVTAPKY